MYAGTSDPWNDVSHEVSIDPVGDVIIHICHLEKFWNLRVFGAAHNVYNVSHAQVLAVFLMITAIPALTWRKTRSGLSVEAPLA